jgi:hypothetical protein
MECWEKEQLTDSMAARNPKIRSFSFPVTAAQLLADIRKGTPVLEVPLISKIYYSFRERSFSDSPFALIA